MSVSGISGLFQPNAYTTDTKRKNIAFGFDFSDPQAGKKTDKNSAAPQKDPAKSAGEIVAGLPAGSATTAATLWQTQNIAQSEESSAIDVEEVKVKPKSTAEQFLDQMNKTPEELMREAVLKELGYTEEDLKNMDPKELAKVEAKIKELIETKIEEAMREKGIDIDSGKRTASSLSSMLKVSL